MVKVYRRPSTHFGAMGDRKHDSRRSLGLNKRWVGDRPTSPVNTAQRGIEQLAEEEEKEEEEEDLEEEMLETPVKDNGQLRERLLYD